MSNRVRENLWGKKEQILHLKQDIIEKDAELLEIGPALMDLMESPVTAETLTGEEAGEDSPEMIRISRMLTGAKTEPGDTVHCREPMCISGSQLCLHRKLWD